MRSVCQGSTIISEVLYLNKVVYGLQVHQIILLHIYTHTEVQTCNIGMLEYHV